MPPKSIRTRRRGDRGRGRCKGISDTNPNLVQISDRPTLSESQDFAGPSRSNNDALVNDSLDNTDVFLGI